MLERLKVFEVEAPYRFVLFDHNPEMLKVSRRAKNPRSTPRTPTTPAPPGSGEPQSSHNGADPTVITVSKARLIGLEVKLAVDQLLSWLSPGESPWGEVDGQETPTLLMQWGPPKAGFTFTCKLKSVDVVYVRVSMAGVPTHAVINLSLSEHPSGLPMTNPTSGGRPGRDRHIVLGDESLMSIATSKFGSPAAWRAIADINDIDDPASIRPGDMLYLPGPAELSEMAGRAAAHQLSSRSR